MVSDEAFERSLAQRVSMNRAILKNRYFLLPVDDVGYEEFVPVGRGVKSSELCGRWASISTCENFQGHEGKVFKGVDVTGKIIARHNHLFCTKSSCPVCFLRGWSVRQARSIEARLVEGVKRGFGKVEHCVVSVPVAERGLPESVFRVKCRDALVDRGVIGGVTVFHGYRMDRKRNVLYWAPHYHVLCFIDGGFDRCRDCVHVRKDCYSCDGFKGRESRGVKKDGYLVKVLGERKTVCGTAHYQLNHATIKLGISRFHCVIWFGCCANRKFKSAKVKNEVLCPVCEDEMVKRMYIGKSRLVKHIGSVDYRCVLVFDRFDEDGNPNFEDIVGSRNG